MNWLAWQGNKSTHGSFLCLYLIKQKKWLKCNKILTVPAVNRFGLWKKLLKPWWVFFSRISRTKKITLSFVNAATSATFLLTSMTVELSLIADKWGEASGQSRRCTCKSLFSETWTMLWQSSLSDTTIASVSFCLWLHKSDGKVDECKHLLGFKSSPTILPCNLLCFSWPGRLCGASKVSANGVRMPPDTVSWRNISDVERLQHDTVSSVLSISRTLCGVLFSIRCIRDPCGRTVGGADSDVDLRHDCVRAAAPSVEPSRPGHWKTTWMNLSKQMAKILPF